MNIQRILVSFYTFSLNYQHLIQQEKQKYVSLLQDKETYS